MRLIRFIKHVCYHTFRGAFGNLPTFGRHPGLVLMLLLLVGLPALAGWLGLLINSILFLPIFLWGSYFRSLDDS
jgi:hypothetical protein